MFRFKENKKDPKTQNEKLVEPNENHGTLLITEGDETTALPLGRKETKAVEPDLVSASWILCLITSPPSRPALRRNSVLGEVLLLLEVALLEVLLLA